MRLANDYELITKFYRKAKKLFFKLSGMPGLLSICESIVFKLSQKFNSNLILLFLTIFMNLCLINCSLFTATIFLRTLRRDNPNKLVS